MKAIDNYLLRQIVPTLLVTIFIAAVILLMERLMRLLDIAVGNGVSTLVVFQMLFNLIPHYIGLALPMALFLGVLLAFRKLSSQSELDAIQSTGIGLSRFIRAAMWLALVMGAFNFVLAGYIQPFTRYAYRAILFNITSGVIEQGIGEGIFMNLPNGYTLRVERSSGAGRELSGVFAHKQNDDGTIVTLTAKKGELVTGADDGIVTMRLFSGNRSEWTPATGESATLKFEVFDWPLDLAALVQFRGRGGDERELTIGELLDTMAANRAAGRAGLEAATDEKLPPAQKLPPSAVEAEFHGRIVFTLSMLLLPVLAAPLGIMTRRVTRSFGLIFGLLVLVSYHKVLEFTEAYAATTGLVAAPILWGVFAGFTVLTLILFRATDVTAGATPIQRLESRWFDMIDGLISLVRPKKGGGVILSRYLMRAFLARFVGLLLGLVLFLQTLDLLATANEVLAGGGAPLDSLARYVMLRAPSLMETVAPLAGLLGALTALVTFAKNSEVLAMRAAGRSVLSLVGGLVAVGTALSILLFVFSETVVVRTNGMLEDWRDAGFKPDGQIAEGENSWMMEDTTIIRVGHVMRGGTELLNLRLLKQGQDADISDIIDIDKAVWTVDRWELAGVRRVGGLSEAQTAPPEWKTQLRPEHFMRFANHPNELSLNALQEYVGNVAIGSRPQYFYDTWLHQKIAGPIVLALMPLLAAIAAFAHHRQGSAVLTIVWGITLGFLFIVIDNMILAMGQFGSLPPFVAAWLPLILFLTLGLWIVFNFEHTGART